MNQEQIDQKNLDFMREISGVMKKFEVEACVIIYPLESKINNSFMTLNEESKYSDLFIAINGLIAEILQTMAGEEPTKNKGIAMIKEKK